MFNYIIFLNNDNQLSVTSKKHIKYLSRKYKCYPCNIIENSLKLDGKSAEQLSTDVISEITNWFSDSEDVFKLMFSSKEMYEHFTSYYFFGCKHSLFSIKNLNDYSFIDKNIIYPFINILEIDQDEKFKELDMVYSEKYTPRLKELEIIVNSENMYGFSKTLQKRKIPTVKVYEDQDETEIESELYVKKFSNFIPYNFTDASAIKFFINKHNLAKFRLNKFLNLESLECWTVFDEDFKHLKHLTQLKQEIKGRLEGTKYVNSVFKDFHLNLLPNLRVLEIGFQNEITDEGLKKTPLLEVLEIKNGVISNKGIQYLKFLKTLKLFDNNIITGDVLKYTPLLIHLNLDTENIENKHLEHLKHLRTLFLFHSELKVTGKVLENFPNLEFLSLITTPEITDKHLKKLIHLKFLNISSKNGEINGSFLANTPNLIYLFILSPNLIENKHIGGLKKLESVYLPNSKIRYSELKRWKEFGEEMYKEYSFPEHEGIEYYGRWGQLSRKRLFESIEK